MTIYFYHIKDKYGCFSNFSPHGFEMDGLWWNTNEHYFQAQKYAGTSYAESIRTAKTPKEAARIGRDRSLPLRSDWNQVKENMMKKGVLKKFQIHTDIREILLSTGNELIIEDSPVDYYWGCGKDGTGKNRLGHILMEVRELLRQQKNNTKLTPN